MFKKILMISAGLLIAWMVYGLFATSQTGAVIFLAIFAIWGLVVWTQSGATDQDRENDKQTYWSLVEIMKKKGHTREYAIRHLDELVRKGIPRDEIIARVRSY